MNTTGRLTTSTTRAAANNAGELLNLNADGSGDADRHEDNGGSGDGGGGGTATVTRPAPPRVDRMPLWKVLLHNDEKNDMGYVVETILELTTIGPQIALVKMLEAHKTGVALLVTAHREYAELLQEQFTSKRLTVTIEPDR
jgi:ATP-dependent Clp protease adaptor protein ClpS